MLQNLFYYLIYSSVVLVYGIGIERAGALSKKQNRLFIKAIKMLICVTSTTSLSYLFVKGLLVPAGYADLYPFFTILIFISISVFVETIIRITSKVSANEFGTSLLFIFISLSEGLSLADSVLISCICVLSLFATIPIIYSIHYRLDLNAFKKESDKTSYVLISLAIIMLILLFWNNTWLNMGAYK